MTPITFACEEQIPMAAEEIAAQIMDLSRWPEFRGYGIIPGIKSAEFERRTGEIVGTKIRVTNHDESSHVEEIVEWQPSRRIALRMQDFSAPLARLATHFEETWEFEPTGATTRVIRSFRMHAKSGLSRPILWLISIFLKKAIRRHLRQLRDAMRTEVDRV